MSHQCRIEGSSAVCIENRGQLWVKEHADSYQREGRTYPVKFCPECGFKPPKKRCFAFFDAFSSEKEPDESITKFSQSLSTAISHMNYNVELIKTFMSSQNTHNELFIESDQEFSMKIEVLQNKIKNIEKTISKNE